MKTTTTTRTLGILSASILASGISSAALIAYEFNNPGDPEGWVASSAPAPNGVVTGFTTALGIDGVTGVATSADINIDPQLTRPGLATLPVGDTWATFTIRFRQLTLNPGENGVAGATLTTTGTLLFFNGTTANRTPGPTGIATQVYAGTGGYTGDTYTMTVTPEADNWQVITLDLTAAPTLNSQNLTNVRFDPVGNNAAGNFEVDYVRIQSIPEPGSVMLSALAGLGLLRRRRK
ncbi:PEP-CTERM sorting domain-containing protein [Akkermansiaceae bacterium]|nr:PEP-CTERM sorting domain-containing protein [Akkermansiaceae bacterium]